MSQYLFSMSLCPREGFRFKVPAVTTAELVLMSWLFCTISEDHVAVAVTCLLGFKKEQKDIVIPTPRSSCCHGLVHLLYMSLNGLDSRIMTRQNAQGVRTRTCKVCVPWSVVQHTLEYMAIDLGSSAQTAEPISVRPCR